MTRKPRDPAHGQSESAEGSAENLHNSLRAHVLADPTVPKPLRDALERGLPLDEIRLDPHGQWWHRGNRVEHPRIVELFSRSVDRTEGGTYVLRVSRFTYPIVVEDTPFFIVAATVDRAVGRVHIQLNDGTGERLDLDSLRYEGPGRLLARVKSGRHEARFLRGAYHTLLDQIPIREEPEGYVMQVGTRRIVLGSPRA